MTCKLQAVFYYKCYKNAREFTKKGYYLGIGGVVTFKNAVEIKKVVEGIDLSYLLSETDSPYLTPVPYRGKLNQPAYTKYVVEEIAKSHEKGQPVLVGTITIEKSEELSKLLKRRGITFALWKRAKLSISTHIAPCFSG